MPSSIPAAVSNLFTLMTAVFVSQTNVQVVFSKFLPEYVSPITIQIKGFAGDQQPAELGPNYKREETFQIPCEIASFAGDQLHMNRLSEVMTIFATFSATIANNWTLPSTVGGNDGAVRFAEVGTFNYAPDDTDAGKSLGILDFDVHCSQRILSLS